MKPWMLAALLGAVFGFSSRYWLSVEVGRGRTIDGSPTDYGRRVNVIVGIGNTINYNYPRPIAAAPQEKSHAEGA